MSRPPKILAVIFWIIFSSGVSPAQEDAEARIRKGEMPLKQQDDLNRQTSKMDHMSDAMASMAQTCETMMHREMAAYPLKVAALVGLGVLGSVALLLFIVLEIQWIRYFSLRNKQVRNALGAITR